MLEARRRVHREELGLVLDEDFDVVLDGVLLHVLQELLLDKSRRRDDDRLHDVEVDVSEDGLQHGVVEPLEGLLVLRGGAASLARNRDVDLGPGEGTDGQSSTHHNSFILGLIGGHDVRVWNSITLAVIFSELALRSEIA